VARIEGDGELIFEGVLNLDFCFRWLEEESTRLSVVLPNPLQNQQPFPILNPTPLLQLTLATLQALSSVLNSSAAFVSWRALSCGSRKGVENRITFCGVISYAVKLRSEKLLSICTIETGKTLRVSILLHIISEPSILFAMKREDAPR
jgi:hypothetical protein